MSKPLVKAYIAGPDVFYPDAKVHADIVRELCAEHGIEALIPIDNEVTADNEAALSLEIFKKNVELIRKADFVIANIEPFRGPSADAGTVWEIGCAYGMDKKVFTFTHDNRSYKDRVVAFDNIKNPNVADLVDSKGMTVENFNNNTDNLMIQHSVESILPSLKAVLTSPELIQEIKAIEKKIQNKNKPKI